MKITRILHVSLNVLGHDDATRRFYAERMGLEQAKRPEIPGVPGAWFAIGDAQLHLVGAPAAGEGIDPTGHHFCVAVEDLDAAVAELDADGIPYFGGVQHVAEGDVVQVWFTDPAGNTVELQQEPHV